MNMYKVTGAIALFVAVLGSEIKAQTYTWSPAGPVLSAGRSRNMIIDRTNPNKLFIGSVSSGLFSSSNAGSTWSPVNDQDVVRNISYLAQGANGTIYAATGEGFLRATAKSKAIAGTGIYSLNPSSNTLVQIKDATVTGTVITRIACHPSDPNKMAIAGDLGLLITLDGGSTWTQASGAIAPTATALTVHYDNAGNIYATYCTSLNNGGAQFVKVAKSSGDPAAFQDITPPKLSLPDQNYGRIELGIANSNNNTIYASVARPTTLANASSASLYGFFVSKDAGANWTLILEGSPQLDPLSNGGSLNSGDYAHCVTVNPLNQDDVLLGSYKLYSWTKTTGGPEGVGTWTRHGNELFFGSPLYLRQNIHDLKVSTSGSTINGVYIVTDAGVYKSVDGLLTFQFFSNGLGTAQFNSIDITRFPKTSKTTVGTQTTLVPYSGFIAATAGNGVSYFNGNYPSVTEELNYLTGDYFNAVYSKLSPKTSFFTSANSNIYVAPDITANEPGLFIVSHLGSECSADPSITQIDFRGIANNGSTKDEIYSNNSFTSVGTPFKLWENTGNVAAVDSALFFNDTIRVLIPVTTTVGATTAYTVSLIKPQASAIIDKITISSFTVAIATATASSCFGKSAIQYSTDLKATMEFGGASSPTTLPSSYTLTGLTSSVVNAANKLSIDPIELKDVIQFELPYNPLVVPTASAMATSTANHQFVRVGVTVFYRYNSGAKIIIQNGNISNLPFKDSISVGASGLSWTYNNVGTNSLSPVATSAPYKFKLKHNSRLAILNDKRVLVSKRPLNTNDPQKFQAVSVAGALTTNSGTYTAGQATITGAPYLLEWAPNGKAIYYVTAVTTGTPTYRVYKVNMSASMFDFSIEDYRGAYYTGAVTATRTSPTAFTFTTNTNSPFRTTLIGTFPERITNISVSDDSKSVLLTSSDVTTNKRIYLSSANCDLDNIDNTLVTWSDKTGDLPSFGVYCALFEMTDNKRVLIGTDRGVYATTDITAGAPSWGDAKNNQLPNVQIFDIKQQKLSTWDTYSSGMIYVATNGRGAWMNKNFATNSVIGVEEKQLIATNKGLSVYPNPTNGDVTVSFFATGNENITISILDINGRVIKSEKQTNLSAGYTDHTFNVNDLNNGVYIVSVTSTSGIKRVTKLIVSK